VCKITILFILFFFVFESNKSASRIIYYLKIIQDVVLGHPPPCTQISLWDLMNELLNVIGCCCPPPSHPFLLPSDTRGNACLPPCRDGFSILPRSGDDEIRFPQWRWWNTAPAYYYAIGNLSFLISSLSLSYTLSRTLSIYLYISIHCSLFPRCQSRTRVYIMILSLTRDVSTAYSLCVCVWCHVFFPYTPTHPPPAVVWQRQTLLVIYNRSHWYHLMSRRRFSSHYRLMHGRAV